MMTKKVFGIIDKTMIMKKYSHIALAVLAILSLSCSKQDPLKEKEVPNKEEVNIEEPGKISVQGIISEEISTKTDYDIDWAGHTATFSWKGTEVFSRMGFDGYYITRQEYSGTASDSGEDILTFTGASVTNDTGYAFYPGAGTTNGMGWGTGSGTFKVAIPSTSVYDAANPIKGYIPMMGKLNNSGTLYEFIPLTGVLALRITNIPAEATTLTISSPNTSGGFSGNFKTGQLPGNTLTALDNIWNSGFSFVDGETSGRTFTFSNLNSADTYYFYFPTPVGELNGLKIEMGDETGTFYTVTSSKTITITRGVIMRLPLMTLETPPSAIVAGDLNDRRANFTYNGAEKIKYAVTTSSTEHLSSLTPSETTDASVSLHPASEGTNYLVYQGYKADGTTKVGPEQRTQFLSSNNSIAGVYKMYTTDGVYGNANATTGSGTFVLEVTDDSSKGDIILSCFAGVSGQIYGRCEGEQIIFNKDDLFGANPFSNVGNYPYVAIDAFTTSVQNPVFDIVDADNIEYTLSSNLGLRATTASAWTSYGGGWPWEICFGTMTATRMGNRVDLTPDMLTLSIDAGKYDGTAHYDGQGKKALTDGNYSTFWHTPYYNRASTDSYYGANYYSCADLDSTYGAYIDIDLGAGNEMTKFSVRTKMRLNQSNGMKVFDVYGTNDKSNWGNRIGQCVNALAGVNWGDWLKTPVECTASEPVRYIRVAFTTAYNNGDKSLTDPNSTNYMHLAELEIYNND